MWKAPFFCPGSLNCIGYLDETDGSLDDTTGQRGGRPPMMFFAPALQEEECSLHQMLQEEELP
jgi:hypothetical protein